MQNPPPGPPPGGQPPSYPPQGGQPGYPPPGGQPGYPPPGGQPHGYPPPGYQPPGSQQGYQPVSSGGVDKKTGAILSYLLGWLTGIIFLFVGKNDPDVKYHAAQSVVFFGGVTIVFWAIALLSGFIGSLALDILLGLIRFALAVVVFVIWIMCLVRAAGNNGMRFPIPLFGGLVTPYAEQLANAVN